jgi:peptidoglycan/xylan/chitin deacetylase (PgdA/CDA1 family)
MGYKPLASISLDLDNLWSYLKTHGDPEWMDYPSYYDIFVPYILDILRELDIKITFFIVGLDAADIKNKNYLMKISEEGHDIGNHSFNHEVWINQYTRVQFEDDLEKAEKSIYEATGKKTNGFRGPGFSWSKTMLEVLYDHQYLYDSSSLPTFIGPFARMYYFWKSDFPKDEKLKRKNLFGPFSGGFRRLKPFYWDLAGGKKIAEIPITTMPILKLPFHLSYLLYLNNISPVLMKIYLNTALFLCKLTRTPVSFLLHPLDIIGGDQIRQLAFFPGMTLTSQRKIEVLREVVSTLKKRYRLVNISEYHITMQKETSNKKNRRR